MDQNTEKLPREQRVEIIHQLAKEFPPTHGRGTLNFKGAFAAHPEWRAQLGADTIEGMHKLYPFARSVLKSKGVGRGKWKRRKKSESMVVAAPRHAAPVRPVMEIAPGCRFCPHCGGYLEIVNQAVAATEHLTTEARNGHH